MFSAIVREANHRPRYGRHLKQMIFVMALVHYKSNATSSVPATTIVSSFTKPAIVATWLMQMMVTR